MALASHTWLVDKHTLYPNRIPSARCWEHGRLGYIGAPWSMAVCHSSLTAEVSLPHQKQKNGPNFWFGGSAGRDSELGHYAWPPKHPLPDEISRADLPRETALAVSPSLSSDERGLRWHRLEPFPKKSQEGYGSCFQVGPARGEWVSECTHNNEWTHDQCRFDFKLS